MIADILLHAILGICFAVFWLSGSPRMTALSDELHKLIAFVLFCLPLFLYGLHIWSLWAKEQPL